MLGLSGPVGRCDAQPDRLSAGQANSPDPRHLRASRRGGGRPRRRDLPAAPQVHILATSREALRVEGEHVYRLEPLACPPDDPALTAAAAQTFPATQLFVERAAASGARLDLGDADAAHRREICRKLDGVALAIELAARRVEAYGLQQTAALLDQRLTLLWLGPRTAPPRQKTLQATLDWSYGLLSEVGARGAAPARRVRRTFHARCGAGSGDERDRRSDARSSAPSTASSPSRWWRPAPSGR